MSDRIDFGGQPWRAVPRSLLRDKRLSAQAKGGLVTLLSHDEGWIRSAIALVMKENRRCGRAQARAILKELVDAGYAELNQQRGTDGKFSTAYTIHAESRSAPGTSLSPGAGERGAVSPGAGNRSAVVEPQDVEPREEEPQGLPSEETLGQRSNRLAKVYTDKVKLSNFPQIAALVRKAIAASFSDDEIAIALGRLADAGRPVTTDTLRIEMEGWTSRPDDLQDRLAEGRRLLHGAAS